MINTNIYKPNKKILFNLTNVRNSVCLSIVCCLCTTSLFAAEVVYQGNDLQSYQAEVNMFNKKNKDKKTTVLAPKDSNQIALANENKIILDFNPNNTDKKNIPKIVMGGYAKDSVSENNIVEVLNGKVSQFTIGGYSDSGIAKNNKILLNGGELTIVYGGATEEGNLENNEVIMTNNAQVARTLVGGYSKTTDGYANNNKVNITGGTFSGLGDIMGAWAINGHTDGNYVKITGNPVFVNSSSIFGGRAKLSASNNRVDIIGSPDSIKSPNGLVICGGVAEISKTINAQVFNNEVYISGGYLTLKRAYGGKANFGTTNNYKLFFDGRAPAPENDTEISILAAGHGKGEANNNQLVVIGGKINQKIVGGEVGEAKLGEHNYMAHNNTVTLGGNIKVNDDPASNFYLLGGAQYNKDEEVKNPQAKHQLFTGNSLNIQDDFSISSGKINKIVNFEFYNFVLPKNIRETLVNQDDKSILIADVVDLTDGASNNSIIDVDMEAIETPFAKGDKVILIKAENDLVYNFELQNEVKQDLGYFYQGLTIFNNKLVFDKNNNEVYLKVDSSDTISFTEASIASMAIISGLNTFPSLKSRGESLANNNAFGFASINGASIKHKIGSHVKYKGATLLAGIGKEKDNLTYGLFFEGGRHTYDTYNKVASLDMIGDGTVKLLGVGIFSRIENENKAYFEAVMRYGKVKNDYTFTSIAGMNIRTKMPYWGGSLALGKKLKISDKAELDLFSKFAFAKQSSKNTTVNNEEVRFNAIKSNKIHLGARMHWETNIVQPYVGLGYEYEFDGKSTGKVGGNSSVYSKSLGGSSFISELGLKITPTKINNLAIGLGMQAYAGKTKGVNGIVNIKLDF